MDKKTIYVVVKYPKKINVWDVRSYDFHTFSKSTSNLTVMRAYFKEMKERHGEYCYVHLVTRERAKEMSKKWYNKYCKEEPALALEDLDRRLNRIEEKHAFYL